MRIINLAVLLAWVDGAPRGYLRLTPYVTEPDAAYIGLGNSAFCAILYVDLLASAY
jgi:hypothetical protein